MKFLKTPKERDRLGRWVKGCINPNKRGECRNCLICNKSFWIRTSRIKTGRGKYCSRKCKGLASRRKHFSIITEFKKGNTPYFKGRLMPEDVKDKISKANTGRKQSLEEIKNRIESIKKAWDKKGRKKYKRYIHLTATPEYKQWRSAIFKRDDFTCQNCGKTNCYLHVHHIKSWVKYPELRFDTKNGITLCFECHNLIPKK